MSSSNKFSQAVKDGIKSASKGAAKGAMEFLKNKPKSDTSNGTTHGETTYVKYLNAPSDVTPVSALGVASISPSTETVDTYEQWLNHAYETAEKQRAEAERRADIERERAIVDANSSYVQNKATYGANAEALGRMGLSGGGYSDYLDSQAYAKQRAETQFANAQANASKREARYLEDQARSQADKEYFQNKENEATYQKAAYSELLTGANNGTYSADQLSQLAKEYGLTGEQTTSLLNAANEYKSNEASANYLSMYDLAKSGEYTGAEIRDFATRAGLNPDDIANLISVANGYDEAIKNGDPNVGKKIEKDLEDRIITPEEWNMYESKFNDEIDTSIDAFDGMTRSEAKKYLNTIKENPLARQETIYELTASYNQRFKSTRKTTGDTQKASITFLKDGSFLSSTDLATEGNNFSIKNGDETYYIQSAGLVTDADVVDAASEVNNNEVFGYNDQIFIKKDGNVYKIEKRAISFPTHYDALHKAIYGE